MIAAKRLRASGAILLVVGLLAAVIIFCTARPPQDLGILGDDVLTKRDSLQLEKIGGRSYILFNDFNEWFASLWHGQRPAYTVGVLSIAGFLSCRWLAGFLEDAPASDDLHHANDENA
jgi:hypothetical protein